MKATVVQKFCSSYFLSDVYQTQSFSLYKKTICELHSEKFLHSMNIYYCALSHYLKRHVTNKQLNIMHFCWRSLDDKSLSSLLELRKNVFPMHVYKYCKNYMLKVYGYDYGMIYFDTRLWYFTQDEENNFQHSKHKGYV